MGIDENFETTASNDNNWPNDGHYPEDIFLESNGQIFSYEVKEGIDIPNDFNISTNNPQKEKKIKVIDNQNQQLRKNKFNLAKNRIYKSCMTNIDLLIEEILKYFGIYNLEIKSKIKKKIKHSFEDNNNFFEMIIKDIICVSTPKSVKINKKEKKTIYDILEAEKKNPNQKIKVLNAILNLTYKDFFLPYLEDKSQVYIFNDNNGNSKVDFFKDEPPGIDKNNCYLFSFKTYAESLNDDYSEELKKEFKEKMFNLLSGKLKGRRSRGIKKKNYLFLKSYNFSYK